MILPKLPSGTFHQAIQTVKLCPWSGFQMTRGPDGPVFRASSDPEQPTLTEKVQALLDHIRALDKTMDDARTEKLTNIKKALADGTYHVSAAEVARKIVDAMREP
jgi:anti-sigma28 factor (negative regulator of flagellin synthesis)